MSNQPPAPINHNRDALLMAWWEADKAAEIAKANEENLRNAVLPMMFPQPYVGTNNFELGGGYKLKAEYKQNYSIKKNEATGDYSHVAVVLAKLPPAVAAELVRWKPELSITAYKKLTAEEQAIVNTIVTITDGKPTLEMVTPKK